MFPIMIPIPNRPDLAEIIKLVKSEFPSITPDVQLDAVLAIFEAASDNYANAIELHSNITKSMEGMINFNKEDLIKIIPDIAAIFAYEMQGNEPRTETVKDTENKATEG